MFWKQAMLNIENNKFDRALPYVEKIYETDKSDYTNSFYVSLLFTLERFEEALEIANEQKVFYLTNEEHRIIYGLLLVKNKQFLEAELLIRQNKTDTYSPYKNEWTNLEKELELERELVAFEIEMEKIKIREKLNAIGSYALTEQAEIIQAAYELPLKDLQIAAQNIFANSFIAGNIQRSLLEVLIEKEDSNTYSFQWFNQYRKICPNELQLFSNTLLVKNIDEILEHKLHKEPSLLEIVKAEIINDLLLIYPFIEEVVTDIDYWVDCYIAFFDNSNELNQKTIPSSDAEEQMHKVIEQLNTIASRHS